jgi:hypothetical protein
MTYIITEEVFDKLLLEKVLPSTLLSKVEILSSGGYSAALSKASSILSYWQEPVILMVNAQSNNLDAVRAKRSFIYEILSATASDSLFKIVLIEPESEVLLFQDIDILKKMTAGKISELEFNAGKFNPRNTLMSLFGFKKPNERLKLMGKMDSQIVLAIQKTPIIQELMSHIIAANKILSPAIA